MWSLGTARSIDARWGLLMRVFVLLSVMMITVEAHVAAWHKGMYCLNGTDPNLVEDSNDAVQPLYQLKEVDWWFHHNNKCDQFPPAPGDFLELPANGNFTVEHAVNRAFTTLSYGGTRTALFGNGQDSLSKADNESCITEPNIHTQNETMAAGTIFAISYVSDLKQVTKENLVVFSVLANTPWRRLATYQVPNLPACPSSGCICAWGWVPNGCGIPNMYMHPFRCRVVGTTGDAALAAAVPPVWCEDDQSKCVRGAKQMVYWNQLEGNNVELTGQDLSGEPKSPGYNKKMGFSPGAQTDIFLAKGTVTSTSIASDNTPTTLANSSSSVVIEGSGRVVHILSFVLMLVCTPRWF